MALNPTGQDTNAAPAHGLPTKREAIMAAAFDVFARQGYAATSLDDIATATGVSRQTVYNHFGDKERLFLAVVDAELKATLERLRAATEGFPANPGNAEKYLLTLARRMAETFLSPRTAAVRLLVQSEVPRHPQVLELWRAHATVPVWSALIGHLARLAHAGILQIDDPARAAGQFVTLVTGTAWQMTEFGTFAIFDTSAVDASELDAAVVANVRLFLRGYATTHVRPDQTTNRTTEPAKQ